MDDFERMPPPRRKQRPLSSASSVVSSLASVGSLKKKKKAVVVSSPESTTASERKSTTKKRKRKLQQTMVASSLVAATKSDDRTDDHHGGNEGKGRPPYPEYMAIAHAFQDQVYKYCGNATVDAATQQHLQQWCRQSTQQLVDAAVRTTPPRKLTTHANQLKKELKKIANLRREIRSEEKGAEEKKKTKQPLAGPEEIQFQRKLAATRFLNGIDALRQRRSEQS